MPFKGSKQSEKQKRKIGIAMSKWRRENKEKISGKNAPNFGKKHTEEARQKMSEANMGRRPTKETKRKRRESILKFNINYPNFFKGKNASMYGKKHTEETKKKISEAKKGKSAEEIYLDPKKFREQRSRKQKELWGNKKYKEIQLKKQFEGRGVSPNKAEQKLDNLLQKLLPNEYKFVGNGEVILAGKCPDFINVNGQKKIIEFFGDYWHKGDDGKERIDLFSQYGYKTLIVWEYELKDKKSLREKVLRF